MFGKNLLHRREGLDAFRSAAVHRGLKKHLDDLVLAHAVDHSSANMQLQFVPHAEDRKHCEVEEATCLSRQPRSTPDPTPDKFVYIVLPRTRMGVSGRHLLVDVAIAKDFSPELHAELVTVTVHPLLQCSRWRLTAT